VNRRMVHIHTSSIRKRGINVTVTSTNEVEVAFQSYSLILD